jgi:hypothetical protein
MTKYLISFPSRAMEVADDEWDLVGRESHAVVQQAKDAGAWVFGGGIEESVAPRFASQVTAPSPRAPTRRTSGSRAGSPSSSSRRATPRWSGRHASPSPAGARKRSGSSCTTRSPEPASPGQMTFPAREWPRTKWAWPRVPDQRCDHPTRPGP